MKKSFFIISLLLCISLFCCVFPAKLKLENTCFQYVEISKGTKKAIDDYKKHCNNEYMLTLMYHHNDSDSAIFTLNDGSNVLSFMESPTKYYSVYKGRMILIYNGEEKEFNPTTEDIEHFIHFLSDFDKDKIVKFDWEKKELVRQYKGIGWEYDPPFIKYYVDNNRIIRKYEITDGSMSYPERRYKIDWTFDKN